MTPYPALFIVNRFLLVHQLKHCPKVKDQRHVAVTRNMVLVHKMPACALCWPNLREYEQYIYGKKADT